MRKNMVFGWAGNVVILIQTDTPTDEEWKRYTASLRAKKEILQDMSRMKAIAVTEGGSLTPTQRREVNEIVGKEGGLAVVFSTSAIVRTMVTALSWFNPLIKAFALSEKEAAFKHLKLSQAESADVVRTIDRLRIELREVVAKAS
jgi:hypothetical protein